MPPTFVRECISHGGRGQGEHAGSNIDCLLIVPSDPMCDARFEVRSFYFFSAGYSCLFLLLCLSFAASSAFRASVSFPPCVDTARALRTVRATLVLREVRRALA